MTDPVELDADMHAVDGVLVVLGGLADEIESAWSATAAGDDPDRLHELRVAIRRTRVVLDNARSVLPPRFVDEARHSLAGVAAVTGASRDLDTLAERWSIYIEQLPDTSVDALRPIPAVIATMQATARSATLATINQPRLSRIIDAWPAEIKLVRKRRSQGRNAERPLGWLVRHKLQSAHEHLLDHGRAIGKRSPDKQLHDLRIDAKTMRYLTESYSSLLPKGPRTRFLQPVKVLQTNLGAHQDAVAHHEVLHAVLIESARSGGSTETAEALALVPAEFERVQAETRKQFTKCFDAFDTRRTRLDFKDMQRRLR